MEQLALDLMKYYFLGIRTLKIENYWDTRNFINLNDLAFYIQLADWMENLTDKEYPDTVFLALKEIKKLLEDSLNNRHSFEIQFYIKKMLRIYKEYKVVL
uniref:hypothetical protein n=1 Tax=Tetragenococcus halophilus TaxID=51669 RepID=UPI0024E15794|nr:hypothetical protein [Tetragenococcus halophilus]